MPININFIKSKEKEKILEELNKQFGIKRLDYTLVMSGKEKIRGFSGDLSKEDILKINELANIEVIGLYLLKEEHDLRLGFDALHILKDNISKNILELKEEQFLQWIRGFDLDLKVPQGTYVIKYKEDLLGCGKSNNEKLFNYVPKDRRIRK
jgi:NOL1/NOP2/fmu family ribosome biogenesis protein